MTASEQTTIRIRRYGSDSTLNGYIFSSRSHARQWLSQSFVRRREIQLDEVDVGLFMPCRRCGGSGHNRQVRLVRRLTAEEVLNV